MPYETIIFDLDGTLLDTLADLHAATNHTLAAFGAPPRDMDEVRRFVGNGYYNLLRLAFPEGTPEATLQEAVDAFNAWYVCHCEERTRAYDGIGELLRALRAAGRRVAVVSNKGDAAVNELMPKYFAGLYDVCVGERAGIRRKPAPDSVNEVLRLLGAPRETCVFVGDSDVDVATAEAAVMPCVSVTWGFRDEAFLRAHGATCLVDTPEELGRLLGV